jgi:phage repressor protein C with HTH and peptisase S24 domain
MKEKNTTLDRIYKEIKKKRIALTLEEFADALEISRATLFRMREKTDEENKDLIDKANLLLETNNVSHEIDQKEAQITKAPQGRFPKETKPGELIKFYDTDFAAGNIEFYDDHSNITPAYTMDVPEFAGCTAFRAYGDSMEKLIKSGSILFGRKVEDWRSHLEYGQIYGVICTDNRRYLKYIRKGKDENHFLLKSENKENYDDFPMPKAKIKSLWLIHGWINKRT